MTSPDSYADQWDALVKQMDAESAQDVRVIGPTTAPLFVAIAAITPN